MRNTTVRSKRTTEAFRNVSRRIRVGAYACSVQIEIVHSVKGRAVRLYRKHSCEHPFKEDEELAGVALGFHMEHYYVVIANEYLSHNTIAHEVFHITQEIARDRNIAEEEAQAWICGYITELVYSFLRAKNIDINGSTKR